MSSAGRLYLPSPWPNQSVVTVYVCLGIAACLVLIYIFASRSDSTASFIRRHPVVLAPPLLALNLSWLLHHVRPILTATPQWNFLGISTSLSIYFVGSILMTGCAIWLTVRWTHAIEHRGNDSPTRPGPQLLRFLAAYLFGMAMMFALLAAALPLFRQGFVSVLICWGIAGVGFNVLTCTWYAAMISDTPGLWASLATAARFGFYRCRPILLRVILQLIFAGYFVYYEVSTSYTVPPALPSPPVLPIGPSFVNGNWSGNLINSGSGLKSGSSVNMVWVLWGSEDNYWFTDTAKAADDTPWPISRYLIESLTILVNTCFIVSYSRLYLRRPLSSRSDPRTGFDVLPLAVETIDHGV